MLDSNESLLVTRVSPTIVGSQHCCCFRNHMQLNMGGLRLNTLYSKLPLLFQTQSQALNTKWCVSNLHKGWLRIFKVRTL